MADQTRPDPTPIQLDPEGPNANSRPLTASSRQSVSHTHTQGRSRPFIHQRNSSSTSIDSTTFLDHRHQPQSIARNMSMSYTQATSRRRAPRGRHVRPDGQYSSDEISDRGDVQDDEDDETMRLMSQSYARQSFAPWTKPRRQSMDESTRLLGSTECLDTYGSRPQTRGTGTSPPRSGRRSSPARIKYNHRFSQVNHPNSVPSSIGSPPPRGSRSRGFSLVGTGADGETVSMPLAQRAQRRLTQDVPTIRTPRDVLIDIDPLDQSGADLSALPSITQSPGHSPPHSFSTGSLQDRRKTYKAEEDVCFPTEDPSPKSSWPDYEVLEEWAAQEAKGLDEGSAAVRDGEGGFLSREGHRKVSEPVMVDGRYRRAYTFPSAVPYEVCPFSYCY